MSITTARMVSGRVVSVLKRVWLIIEVIKRNGLHRETWPYICLETAASRRGRSTTYARPEVPSQYCSGVGFSFKTRFPTRSVQLEKKTMYQVHKGTFSPMAVLSSALDREKVWILAGNSREPSSRAVRKMDAAPILCVTCKTGDSTEVGQTQRPAVLTVLAERR